MGYCHSLTATLGATRSSQAAALYTRMAAILLRKIIRACWLPMISHGRKRTVHVGSNWRHHPRGWQAK